MPHWRGRFQGRVSIAAFFTSKQRPCQVAGLATSDPLRGVWQLRDPTGVMDLPTTVAAALQGPTWLALTFQTNDAASIDFQQAIHDRGHTQDLLRRGELLQKRFAIYRAVREFFHARDFLDVDTPTAVRCPGMEPYLDSFSVGDLYLRTSPELHMKRLLAGGFERIFQIGPCFRAGDRGRQHREEFAMLEWYRLFADLDHIRTDTAALLRHLAPYARDRDYFEREPEQVSCVTLFERHLNVTLSLDPEPLRACLRAHGDHFDDSDDWDTLFFRLFLQHIEPHLGQEQPTFVTDYPASQAALAKCAPVVAGALPTCYRFELFVKGRELANAFYEVTDAEEQRRRFEADLAERKLMGKRVYPLDEPFLEALGSGLPPAAGIALGMDRLVSALLDTDSLDAVLPFPSPNEE